MTRKKIKDNLKQTCLGAATFDEMIHSISIYIFNNCKFRNKPIDSEKIFKKKRKKRK